MRIVELVAYLVELPLRKLVKHASAARRESINLVVRCRLADGTEGWGEGVPRHYVTGETPEGALEQLSRTPLADCLGGSAATWSDVVALCQRFQPAALEDDPRGCRGNALRAAVELSILDAFGSLFREPVSRVAQHFPPVAGLLQPSQAVRYSGAITAETPRRERISALKMRLNRFAHCKVKVGVPGADDVARLRRIRRWIGRRIDLRLDANEAWSGSEASARIEPLLRFGVSCVEQPVAHQEVDALAEVRRQVRVPLMLDESLTSMADATRAIERGTCDLFNIRLSKCGGFLNSLRLAALARQHGLGYQLGCHPGESGILSAAGRHWATALGGMRYLEGSYDRHLMRERLTEEDLTFGYGGWARAIQTPGLGIHIDLAGLARVTRREAKFPIDP